MGEIWGNWCLFFIPKQDNIIAFLWLVKTRTLYLLRSKLLNKTGVLPRTYGIASTSGPNAVRKMEWPELVGMTVEEAERKIKEDMPGVQTQVIEPNCLFTMDFNQRRVRLLVDSSGKVQKPPRLC
ncbi:hypothetical protein SLEP1_g17836 [Rubroshorea leprosula]|uniref:Uncharacterized protein n=1 Tax=Rubroshorea leprosula TaxID=152421 RepID=A0AAV5J144_9ROSI|nr:hypothetical protein SLEP1_g17836 [Rubroshorea leprosula]